MQTFLLESLTPSEGKVIYTAKETGSGVSSASGV
jgi:hypothetical protein